MKLPNHSKFIVSAFLIAQIFAMSPDVLAADAKRVSAPSSVQALGFANVAPVQPGKYSFNVITEQREKLFRELSKLDQQNKTTIEAAIKEVDKTFNELVQESYETGLRKLADESQDPDTKIFIDAYLTAKRKLEQTTIILNSKISMLNSLQDSGATLQTAQGEVSLSPSVRANLKKVADNFTEQRNTFLSEINKLTVNIYSKRLQTHILQAVSEPLEKDLREDKFGAKNAEQLRNAAIRAMTAGDLQKKQMHSHTQYLFQNTQTLINVYGKEQVYRFETDKDGLKLALENLNNMMFVRSYLRVKYGIPLGSIAVKYDKERFNFDLVTFQNDMKFYQINGLDANAQDLRIEARNSLKNALLRSSLKSAPFLQEGSGFATQVLSALNTVRGEKAWAYINTVILNSLLQDMDEEMMLGNSLEDGTLLVRDHFKARFAKTAKDKEANRATIERYEKIIVGKVPVTGNSSDANSVLFQEANALKNFRGHRDEGATMLRLANEMDGDTQSKADEDERVKGLLD